MKQTQQCTKCNGIGMIRTKPAICMTCHKHGCSNCGGTGFVQHMWIDCPTCIGTGTNDMGLINSVIGKKKNETIA